VGTDDHSLSEQSSAEPTLSPHPIDFLDLRQLQLDEDQEPAFDSYGFIDPLLPPSTAEDDNNYPTNQVLCESSYLLDKPDDKQLHDRQYGHFAISRSLPWY
jgi:hypothetical protein